MSFLLQHALLLLLASKSVSAVSFLLTHDRDGNMFNLTCHVKNGSITSDAVQFWINETEKIDILTINPSVLRQVNTVSFELLPRYEGEFYCGEIDGEHSDGLGPFVGEWSFVKLLMYHCT